MMLLVSVSRRDIENAIADLVDMVSTEPEPLERLRLLIYVAEVTKTTLLSPTDKAMYDVRREVGSLSAVMEESGVSRSTAKLAINRHCAANGLPYPWSDPRAPLSYVPIL